jgi:hypothetical protein
LKRGTLTEFSPLLKAGATGAEGEDEELGGSPNLKTRPRVSSAFFRLNSSRLYYFIEDFKEYETPLKSSL